MKQSEGRGLLTEVKRCVESIGGEREDGSENGTVLRPGASESMDNSRHAAAVTWLRQGDNRSARRAEHEEWKHGDALRAEA